MNLNNFTKRAAMLCLLGLMSVVAFAQERTVTGVVKDPTGEPMIGVNVMVSGTTIGTVTDFDGNYSLKVPENAKLQFSFIGFENQIVEVGVKTKIDIVMAEDAKSLDEVVVVGYGTMKKSDLTGSVSTVKTEDLVSKGTTTAMEALQGSVPGVSITQSSNRAGGGFDIEIRGKSTMGSNNSPLYVVDGVVCSSIDFLNPQEIQQIDILKDASSTAIYGSRASNGVVIVTTKGAKEQGQKVVKPTISYNGYYGMKQVARMPDFMDAQEFLNYRHLRYLSLKGAMGAQYETEMTAGSYATAYLTAGDVATGSSFCKKVIADGSEFDYRDAVVRDALQQNHYVSVSGNSESVNYHFGLGYQQEQGIYKKDDMDRFNFKGTVDSHINDYISSGFSINAAHSVLSTIDDSAISQAFRLNNFCLPYDENGNLIVSPGLADNLGTVSNQFTSTKNPLLDFENSEYNTKSWSLLANFYLEIRPLKNLNLKTTFSPSYSSSKKGGYEDSMTTSRNLQENYAYSYNSQSLSWTWDNQINYAFDIADHSINLMGLVSTSKYNSESSTINAYDLPAESKWYNLGKAVGEAGTVASGYTEWSMLSYAFRANYSFRGKYMFTGTVRWDGSSRFTSGNRWGSFPSAAAAWRISEEDFMSSTKDVLSNLKLRLSFGTTGNNYTEGSNYATDVVASGGSLYYGFADGSGVYPYYPSGIVNKNLTWELTREFNGGLDFGFLDNRIYGAIDLYSKTSSDLLMSRQLSYEAGGATVTDNIGEVRNKGVEINLTTINVQNKNWKWSTSFSFSHNKNEIVEVNGGTEDDIANGWFIGESINSIYDYEWNGIVSDKDITVPNSQIAIDKGFTPGATVRSCDYYYGVYGWAEGMPTFKDLDNNGVIDAADKSIIGKSDPSWTGSFSTNLSYKNWDFTMSVYTKQNYQVYSSFYGQYMPYGDRGMEHVNMDFYIPKGTLLSCGYDENGTQIDQVYQTETHYGSMPFPNNVSQTNCGAGTIWAGSNAKTGSTPFTITDASYWKVKNICLGYTFDRSLLSKASISSLRLYFNVTNPFVFSKYEGFDPEMSGASLSKSCPSSVTYQFGINLKF